MIRALSPAELTAERPAAEAGERLAYRLGLACLGTCGVLSVALTELAISTALPLVFISLTIGASFLSFLPGRTDRRGVLPHWLIALISLCAFGWAFYEIQWQGESTVLGLAHFFTWIVVVKLLDRDGARDNAELLVTSLFLMVIGAIITGQLIYAILLTVYVWAGLQTLLRFHLKTERERIEKLRFETSAGTALFTGARLKAAGGGGAIGYTMTLSVFAVGVLVFILSPRVGAGMFGPLQTPGGLAVTGFTDKVSFGDIGEIKTSSRQVMRVELYMGGQPVGSSALQPYFRGMTLNHYNGREWRFYDGRQQTSVQLGRGTPIVAGYQPGPRDQVLEQRIRLLSPATTYLFAAYLPFRVEADISRSVRMRYEDRVLYLEGSRRPKQFDYTVHRVTRVTPELAELLNQPVDVELPAWALRSRRPVGYRSSFRPERVASKSLRDYVDRLVADLPLPNDTSSILAVADRIENHLLSGEFTYTLSRDDVDPSNEPVEDFLLHRKRGHCEYFAGAMTLMCQLAGLNTRMVNGYRGGEWNATGGYYIVREEHAHSWVEVHTGAGDWEQYDPTPGSVNVQQDTDSMWNTMRGMYDHVNALWADNVVSYSSTSRDDLLAAFRNWLADLGKQESLAREVYYLARQLLMGPDALNTGYRVMYWISIALIAAAVALLVQICVRPIRLWWRWARRLVVPERRRPRQEGFYARTLDLLAEIGHPKKPSATPLEFMSRLAGAEERFAELPLIARAFYRVHYGGGRLDKSQRREIDAIITRLALASRNQ